MASRKIQAKVMRGIRKTIRKIDLKDVGSRVSGMGYQTGTAAVSKTLSKNPEMAKKVRRTLSNETARNYRKMQKTPRMAKYHKKGFGAELRSEAARYAKEARRKGDM